MVVWKSPSLFAELLIREITISWQSQAEADLLSPSIVAKNSQQHPPIGSIAIYLGGRHMFSEGQSYALDS